MAKEIIKAYGEIQVRFNPLKCQSGRGDTTYGMLDMFGWGEERRINAENRNYSSPGLFAAIIKECKKDPKVRDRCAIAKNIPGDRDRNVQSVNDISLIFGFFAAASSLLSRFVGPATRVVVPAAAAEESTLPFEVLKRILNYAA